MIINRYISRAFFKYLLLVLTVILTLFTIIEFLSRTGSFVKQGMTFISGLGFVLLKVPYVAVMISPLGCMLAPIIILGLMRRNHELIALQSSGMSVYSLLKPLIFCGLALGILTFFLSEFVVPQTITKAYEIQRVLRNSTVKTTRDNNIWLKQNDTIVFIQYYNSIDKTLVGISLTTLGKNFELQRRIDAKSGTYVNDQWILKDAIEVRRNATNRDYDSTTYPELKTDIDIKPSDLKQAIKYSEEMNIFQLYRYVKRVESEGYEASYYKVDMLSKTAAPVTCILMVLFGTGIILSRKKRDAIAGSIVIGTIGGFLYWVFNSVCLSLGYSNWMPALMSAWISNILLASVCGIFLIRAE